MYDVFLSHRWLPSDIAGARALVAELREREISVWFDEKRVAEGDGISSAVKEGLSASRTLISWYSLGYAASDPCQREIMEAYIASQRLGRPIDRLFVVNPTSSSTHIVQVDVADAKYARVADPASAEDIQRTADAIAQWLREVDDRTLGEVFAPEALNWNGRPGAISPRFVGRRSDMWRIHSALARGVEMSIDRDGPSFAQVLGLGGVGKTMLASHYAERFKGAYPGGAFWLRATSEDAEGSPGALERELRGVANELGLGLPSEAPLSEVRRALGAELAASKQPYLWIVDDLHEFVDLDQMRLWMAPGPGGRTIITSLRGAPGWAYGSARQVIALDVLDAPDAFALLTGRTRPSSPGEEDIAAAGLAEDLGRHSLALDIARASREAQSLTFAEYRTALSELSYDELELAKQFVGELPTKHTASIVATISRSTKKLSDEGDDFLQLASVLGDASIPFSLVRESFAVTDGLEAQPARLRAASAIDNARDLSLATRRGNDLDQLWDVHALVKRVVARSAHRSERRDTLETAARTALAEMFMAHSLLGTDLPMPDPSGVLGIHGSEVAMRARTLKNCEFLGALALHYYALGNYRELFLIRQELADALSELLEPESSRAVIARGNLALAARLCGHWQEAEQLETGVVDLLERSLGKDHRETLTARNNLAFAQTDPSTALLMMDEVLRGRRRVLGHLHPETLVALNNRGALLKRLDDLPGARDVAREAVALLTEVHGAEHPRVLIAQANLASALIDLGETEEALEVHQSVLKVRESILPESHPDLLIARFAVAAALQKAKRPDEALRLQEAALADARKLWAPDDPEFLDAQSVYAEMLIARGDYEAGETLQRELAATWTSAVGADHRKTLAAVEALARSNHQRGRSSEARDPTEHVVRKRKASLGPAHRDTMAATELLAKVLDALDRREEAHRLLVEQEVACIELLGATHRNSLVARDRVGHSLIANGAVAQAAEQFRALASDLASQYGDDDHRTISSNFNLGSCLTVLGEGSEATSVMEAVVERRIGLEGGDSSDTAHAESVFGSALRNSGQLTRAREFGERAMTTLMQTLGPNSGITQEAMRALAATLRLFRPDGTAESLQAIVSAFESVEDVDRVEADLLNARTLLAQALLTSGRNRDALELIEPTERACRRALDRLDPLLYDAATVLAYAYWEAGEVAMAISTMNSVAYRFAETFGATEFKALVLRLRLIIWSRTRATDIQEIVALVAAEDETISLLEASPDADDEMVRAARAEQAESLRDLVRRLESDIVDEGLSLDARVGAQFGLAKIYYAAGRTADAIETGAQVAARLESELGAEAGDRRLEAVSAALKQWAASLEH